MSTQHENNREKKILIACTGSVATIKLPLLIDLLRSTIQNVQIKVMVTEHAKHFYSAEHIQDTDSYCDADEWAVWTKRGDPVLHIELSKWADLLVIAPLDANTLAKISNGLCDNLITCVIRAWDVSKPLLFCPAMNTRMWLHPITSHQIATLQTWGYIQVPCISKTLMCGDTGLGAMAEVNTIVKTIEDTLNKQ